MLAALGSPILPNKAGNAERKTMPTRCYGRQAVPRGCRDAGLTGRKKSSVTAGDTGFKMPFRKANKPIHKRNRPVTVIYRQDELLYKVG